MSLVLQLFPTQQSLLLGTVLIFITDTVCKHKIIHSLPTSVLQELIVSSKSQSGAVGKINTTYFKNTQKRWM